MKKIFLMIFALAQTAWVTAQYQEFSGEPANQLVPGATMVRWNTTLKVPQYVQFGESQRPGIHQWSFRALEFLKSPSDKLELIKTETDQMGWIHYRYRQIHNNYPVQGSMIIAHTHLGKVISWNGDMMPSLPVNDQIALSEQQALAIALEKGCPADRYMWQDEQNEKFIQWETGDPHATFFPKGTLVYKNLKNQFVPGAFRLCWQFNIYAQSPLKRMNIYVDVQTGAIVDDENLIHTGNTTGVAVTAYSGTKNIYTDSVNATSYRLRQTVLGLGVETYNLQKSTTYSNTDFTDADNNWNNVNANKDEVATDAHFGAEQTYLYYYNRYGRKSYDNNNTKLRSYVHYSNNYDNAFWDGQRMTYGDGNQFKPLTCLDVAAHEMSHGVTSASSNLVYNGESGALNESFSDIFAVCVEIMVRPNTGNYIIGEQITTSGNGIRNMSNPGLFGDPAAYGDPNYYTGAADNGGVHTNSGVQNKWFFILSKGENSTNFKGNKYNVRGIGVDSAGAIAYRNNAFYLTPNSKYIDSRFYSIQAAKDLYGKCSDAVKQTTNAWYAVNVGAAFDTLVKADFYANPLIICSKNDSAAFYNASSLSATYTWNFGDGQTSTLENPKHRYANYGTYNVKLSITGCNGGQDSVTKTAYIQVDSTLTYCKAFKLPANGAGPTYTSCKGTLKDNGGDNNYSDNSDGYVVIAPTNSSYIKFTFSQFNMENPGDYVYLYEGNGTGGTLIGRYSGNSLPNGGIIYSSTGTVTVRQVSDQTLNYSGFVVDWECVPKVANDAGITAISNVNGRENTTIALKANEPIKVTIKNFGSNTVGNFPVKYKINGGTTVTETYPASLASGSSANYTFATPANFSAGGYYTIEAWTELTGDSINVQNNKYTKEVKQIYNQPVKLPYFQDFEVNAAITLVDNLIGLDSTDEFDYFNSRAGNGRMRTNAGTGYYNSGQRAITFDQFPATNQSGPYNTNLLRLTLNMSNYVSNNIYLDFAFMHHGDETIDSDRVWVRGNDQAAWVQLYNLQTQTNLGVYNNITSLNLTQALKNAGQTPGKSMQIMFGQKNNGTSTSTNANDGITFDDILVWTDVKDVGIATMNKPTGGCGKSNAEAVEVDVFNYGTTLSNVAGKIGMRMNNGAVVSQNVTFNVGRNQTQKFTFTQTLDLSTPGTYIIDTWTELTGDVDAANDSLRENIISSPAMAPLNISVSGPLAFCFGDSVVLTANAGFTTYKWSNGKTTPAITVKSGGNYTCTVTNLIGCSASQSKVVSVSYKPITGFNWGINKNTVTYSNLTTNATSYMWYFGDGDSSNATNPVHIFNTTGTFNTRLVAGNNCGTSEDNHNIVITALGLATVSNAEFSVFPNPFGDRLTITFHQAGSHYLRLVDVSGRLVYEIRDAANAVELQLKDLPAGVYILMPESGTGVKLIKQ